MTRIDDGVYDVAVVGGGIVGLATARALQQRAHPRLLLLEKEARLATHQTGRNSGVVHSGIYYRPGSLKAQLCVDGARRVLAYCDAQRIPYQRCGKVIVAVGDEEVPQLETLHTRGLANGVPGLVRLNAAELRALEPQVRGVAALHLPHVAIVDFARVAEALARDIAQAGGAICTDAGVTQLRETADGWDITTAQGPVRARVLINCGGLHADRLARLAGDRAPVQLIPFRGEYFTMPAARAALVNGLVYPVPDPALPFLGVHFTKTLDGGVHIGPNAVLALKREGYRRRDVSLRDAWELMASVSFWRMARRYRTAGLEEMRRSYSRRAFLQAARRLIPALQPDDLVPAPAGVRAQAIGADGVLLDDFVLRATPSALHVYNAPSPAATACLSIGEAIAERIEALPARQLDIPVARN